jgi:hypothetical protein
MLINDDLPTLLLPIKANSGKLGFGHPKMLDALCLNTAFFIIIFSFYPMLMDELIKSLYDLMFENKVFLRNPSNPFF